jgi:tyrosyl-tRNA synthetase
VGDPSGRSETRPRLTPEEIAANAETYAQQVARILDVNRVRVEYNSTWLAPLDLANILELTGTYTVARMLERDDFAKRYTEQRPISVMEFMYPLMQAYDSVALNADVELGGTDQKFNLLVARTVQERYGLPVLGVPVRKSVRFAEAPNAGRSILAYSSSAPGAAAYRVIAAELAGLDVDADARAAAEAR